MKFKDRLKELRLEMGITQKELATIVGVGRTTISEYESGKIVPSQQKLLKIAEYFGVSVDYLTGVSNAPHNQQPKQEIRLEKFVENLMKLVETKTTTIYGKPLNDYNAEIIKVEIQHVLDVLKIIV